MDSSSSLREALSEDTPDGENFSISTSAQELAGLHISHAASRQELYLETIEQGPTSPTAMTTLSPTQRGQVFHESEIADSTSSLAEEQDQDVERRPSTGNQVASTSEPRPSVLDGPCEPVSRGSQESSLSGHDDSTNPEAFSASSDMAIGVDLKDEDMVKRLFDELQSRGLLEQYGYKKEGHKGWKSTKAELDTGMKQSFNHICKTCEKGFQRRCELK